MRPPVCRRPLMPEEITIAQRHHMLQLAMGWRVEHLHRFIARGCCYGGHRDGAPEFFNSSMVPDTPSLAVFDLHEHERSLRLHRVVAVAR
ncbi:IS1096 element passenger TnpR family protein [Paraburkholderia kirstenboschensis]|uniref:IS1096 element passenger TnpR family protein n=1 Tax=Paraburkholderia kirstenboschensis TaxID=1245436 RepID=UPI001919740B|nr:hypothetical protein [Paraburkholderia kirstenboschensis]